MKVIKCLENLFVYFVRACDFFISGRKEFEFTSNSFDVYKKNMVTDRIVGKKILADIQRHIEKQYSIKINNPIVLELIKESEQRGLSFEWKTENKGKYHSQIMINEKYHMIYISSGLIISKFKSIASHELMHAYLYEKKLYTDSQPLREAMARWIEYKVLIDLGEKKEAKKLMNIKTLQFGSGFKKILQAEKKTKGRHLVAWLLENKTEAEKLKSDVLS